MILIHTNNQFVRQNIAFGIAIDLSHQLNTQHVLSHKIDRSESFVIVEDRHSRRSAHMGQLN